jgi:Homeodomain-like domain
MKIAKYHVRLSDEERQRLRQMLAKGEGSGKLQLRAQILLKADENGKDVWTDNEISTTFGVGLNTISKVRKSCVAQGALETVKRQKPNRVYERVMDGKAEAHLLALSCSPPPEGSAHWTLQLLADKMVELGYVEHVSDETVRKTLKKTS